MMLVKLGNWKDMMANLTALLTVVCLLSIAIWSTNKQKEAELLEFEKDAEIIRQAIYKTAKESYLLGYNDASVGKTNQITGTCNNF
jgi:hypothetical protein